MAILGGGGTTSNGVGFSGGTTSPGRDFIDLQNPMVSNGSVTSFDIYVVGAQPTGETMKLKILRLNGSNYDFIGESQTFTGLTDGVNSGLTLTTAITVLTGDLLCINVTDSNNNKVGDQTGSSGSGIAWKTGDFTTSQATSGYNIINDLSLSVSVVGTASAPTNTVTITTTSPLLEQRNASGQATVVLNGTYTGTATQIHRSIDGAAFTPAITSPSGNAFTDSFVLATGQHTIVYRLSNDTSATATIANVRVGDWFAVYGQSNASGRGTSNQTYANSAGGVGATLLGNDDVQKNLTDPYDSDTGQVDAVSADSIAAGSWIVRFANAWLADQEVPIGLIPCPKGGVPISQCVKTSPDTVSGINLYQSMSRRIALVGTIAGVLYEQGESDAQDSVGTLASTYETALGTIVDDVNTDFAVDTFIIPLHTITASGFNGNGTTTGQVPIRAAQVNVAASNSNAKIGQILTDIDLSGGDGLHFKTTAHLDLVATRMYTSYTTSTLNLSINGISNGNHYIYLNSAAHTEIFKGLVAFSGESASIPNLSPVAGTRVYGYWTGSNAPTDGSGVTGVTV
jgi:hypothetical protein